MVIVNRQGSYRGRWVNRNANRNRMNQPRPNHMSSTRPRYPIRGNARNQRQRPSRFQKIVLKEHKIDIDVVTWNLQGKGSPEEIDKEIYKTARRRPHIVCLQEANFPSSGSETEHYKWFCSGTLGSAILVCKAVSIESISFEQLCEQICIAELTKENVTFKVISCYVPPPTHYLSEDLWTKLTDVIRAIPSNMMFILCGDLNAQVAISDCTEADKKFFGRTLFHKTSNENGAKLRKLARSAHLKAVSTFPKTANSSEITFKDGDVKTQQDFILIPTLRKGYMEDVYTDKHSDYKHFLVCCRLAISQMFKDETEVKSKVETAEKPTDDTAEVSKDETVETPKDETAEEQKGETGDKPEDKAAENPADGPNPTVVISTWNVQGASPVKVDNFLAEHRMPVVCLQGLFLTSDEEIKTEHYTWFTSKKQWAKNVAIMVKTAHDIVVKNFEALSEFLCVADIEVEGKPVKVICCYLPTKSEPEYETVTAKLTELVKDIPEETFFVVAGDFNSKEIPDDSNSKEAKTSDENGIFVKKLADEAKLCLKDAVVHKRWKGRGLRTSISQVTETDLRNPHLILLPDSFMDKLRFNFFARWIPFFENSIVSLWCVEQKINTVQVSEDAKSSRREEDGVQTTTAGHVSVESRDGLTYKSTKYEYSLPVSDDEDEVDDSEAIVSPEDLEKFKNKEASSEDLHRILKDFVIFYGANSKSSCDLAPTVLLLKSFKAGKLGKLISEIVEILDESVGKKTGIIVRIRWNGIVLSECTGEGIVDRLDRFRLKKAVTTSLLNKLGQFFSTVKARRSFFNKGQLPILLNDPKLEGTIKIVDKKTYTTVPDVIKYIDEFFTEDTECELIFGKDFTEEELKQIKDHAKSQKLGFRFISPKPTKPVKFDHIAIFKKFSPQYLRDKLIENKENNIENYKYFYIPPTGSSTTDYRSYISKYESDNFKDETRIIQQHLVEVRAQNRVSTSTKESKPGATSTPTQKTGQQAKTQAQARKTGPQARKTGPQARKTGLEAKRNGPQSGQKRRYQDRYDGYRAQYNEQESYYRSQGGDNRQGMDSRDSWYPGRIDERQRMDSRDPWYPENTGDRQRMDSRDQWQPQESNRMQWEQSSNLRNADDSAGRPQRKRMRLDEAVAEREQNISAVLPKVKMPLWRELDTLILVWPVTKRSQVEERPKQILGANYPTEIIQGPQNTVAVMVTLPLRNRTERKYCLAVGPQPRAVRAALQLIVKHSTVIKPNPTYLCDGATPNFIRYKVPCQTNPRTYLILTRAETGPLTESVIKEILDTFRDSFNEEIFFDKDSYTFHEKMLLMEMAEKARLNSRHFGEGHGVSDHHVCIYKTKSKYEILEEVLKMRGFHPKYVISTDRLPPRLGLNIY